MVCEIRYSHIFVLHYMSIMPDLQLCQSGNRDPASDVIPNITH